MVYNNFPNLFIISTLCSSKEWAYRLSVIVAFLCPNSSERVLTSIPHSIARVANVWRKRWKPLCGIFSFSVEIQMFVDTSAQTRIYCRRLWYIRIRNAFYAFKQGQYLFRQRYYPVGMNGFRAVDDADMIFTIVSVVASFETKATLCRNQYRPTLKRAVRRCVNPCKDINNAEQLVFTAVQYVSFNFLLLLTGKTFDLLFFCLGAFYFVSNIFVCDTY